MGAQYKNYAYGDNAKVLKNRVNNSPSPGVPSDEKKLLSESEKILNDPAGYVPPGQKTIFTAAAEGINKNKAIKRANELGGNYDETIFRNKNNSKSKPNLGPGNGTTNTVPSKLIGAQQEAGTSRFDESKLTLGNNPYTGQVGMFKDGQMQEPGSVRLSGGNLGGTPLEAGQSPFFMKSQAAQGLVPQSGTASAIPGMQQNPAVGMPGGNWTGMLNQDNALFKAQMADVKSGFRGPGTGNPAFATDGGYADKQYKRDQLISQLASFDRANPTANMTPGQLIASRQASSGIRGQLDTVNAELFQADELTAKAKQGMLEATTSRANNAATNMTSSENQKLENQGMNEVWSMREGNENLRHAASLAAGQYAAKTNPKDDPYNNLYPDSLKEYFKTQLTNNPNMSREEYAEMVHSATTSLKNKTGGAGNGITKDRLDKY